MARHQKQAAAAAPEEDMQVITPGDPSAAPEVKLEVVREGEVVASALDKNPPGAVDAAEKVPERKIYRVIRGGMYSDPHTKSRSMIRVGKEIDSLNYSVRDLQRQGIRVERVEANDEPLVDFVE